ncbi:MAG: hypothetical protein PCFJNLEI_00659 [Verrucomicrobiae bacterium]|nr:hypothetical protein [Verrucomicrobiae bacterium]
MILLALSVGAQTHAQNQQGKGRFMLRPNQEFASQEWPYKPGERLVKIRVESPTAGINTNTGLMLALHNWGGYYAQPIYLAWCRAFANRYNVIAISVNYLQSAGDKPELPYDHGYLQAIDCLRALYHVQQQLAESQTEFNPRRCYSMGGSGGGNVTLMVNKFAPHTFACIVDICGMPGLTDEIAYGITRYGHNLNAGYSRDPAHPAYLSPDMQAIRDPGNPDHLKIQFTANPSNKVVIVHGQDDKSCNVVDKITIFRNMVAAGFRPDGHFLTPWFVDGEAVTGTGHSIGNQTKIVERFADAYLLETGKLAHAVSGPTDFERKDKVVYPTGGGVFEIDFSAGPPTVKFRASDK